MGKILVVEDDKLITWSMREIISQARHEMDVCDSIQEALALLKEREYILAFVDMDIKEMDVEYFRAGISNEFLETRLVLITSMTRNRFDEMFPMFCPLEVIEKPFQTETIRALVKRTLELT
ncbi:MAG: response regulator [Acidobacteria bacterium]|nr:response regulator [Acidobacteriota bacterium]MBU1473599.1 response regulator [Acidobacteriota bacterium]MBU2439163.1 response regulator [Acidobacteriota bacterium]